MEKSHKFLLPAILVGLLIIGFGRPVTGQIGPAKLSVDPSSITTNVSTEFSIDIWITDIPENNRMDLARIIVGWFRDDMERISEETNEPGSWKGLSVTGSDTHKDYIGFEFFPENGISVIEDRRWVTLTFHCLGPGITTIFIEGLALMDTGIPQTPEMEPIEVTVHQQAAVGGISTPTNKLEILTPYIMLGGIIVAVSTVIVIKKRRD